MEVNWNSQAKLISHGNLYFLPTFVSAMCPGHCTQLTASLFYHSLYNDAPQLAVNLVQRIKNQPSLVHVKSGVSFPVIQNSTSCLRRQDLRFQLHTSLVYYKYVPKSSSCNGHQSPFLERDQFLDRSQWDQNIYEIGYQSKLMGRASMWLNQYGYQAVGQKGLKRHKTQKIPTF